MITFLDGILAEKDPAYAVLDVNGVGYEVTISLETYESLPPLGDRVKLLTYHSVKEDAEQLFGFSTREERRCFLALVGVSGVGPASAITILSGLSPAALCQAIAKEDAKAISAVKGIGLKTAQRLIVDLKDKLAPLGLSSVPGSQVDTRAAADAAAALATLGYRPAEIQEAVSRVLKENPAADTNQIIRAVITSKTEKR